MTGLTADEIQELTKEHKIQRVKSQLATGESKLQAKSINMDEFFRGPVETSEEERKFRFAFSPIGVIIPYRHAARGPEIHGLLQNGVELVQHVLSQDWCDPLEVQLFVSGCHWRHVGTLIGRIVELSPELEDDDHPLKARCQNCNSSVGKIVYKGQLAEVLLDNSVNSCSAWGPGAILYIEEKKYHETEAWKHFDQVESFCPTWPQWDVVQNAITHLIQNVRSPFEQALCADTVLLPSTRVLTVSQLLNILMRGSFSVEAPQSMLSKSSCQESVKSENNSEIGHSQVTTVGKGL